MKTVLKISILSLLFLCSLLFFWKPASDIIVIKPVDWQQKYKDEVLSPAKGFGATALAKEFLRKERGKISLKEFVLVEMGDHHITTSSKEWLRWIQQRKDTNTFLPGRIIFLSAKKSPFTEILSIPSGYLEVKAEKGSYFLHFYKLQEEDLRRYNVPSRLRFPFRNLSYIFWGLFIVFLLPDILKKKKYDAFLSCSAVTGVKVGIWIFWGSLFVIATPYVYDIPRNAPPFIFIGGFLFLTCLVIFTMFGYQAVFAFNLLKGKDQWAQEFMIAKGEKAGLFYFITILFVSIGGGFILLLDDAPAMPMFLVFLAILTVLVFFAFVMPRLQFAKKMRQTAEFYVGPKGLYFCGIIHSWTLAGARLEKVSQAKKPYPMITFAYSYWMMAGRVLFFFRNTAVVRIPVPRKKI